MGLAELLVVAVAGSTLAMAVGVPAWRWVSTSRSAARADPMVAAGYRARGPERWVRSVGGLPMTYTEGEGGPTWWLALPRYGTFTLRIHERAGRGMKAFGRGTFLTQNQRIDERFVVASDQPAATLDILAPREVQDALLAVPHVALEIRADELWITDPERRNLAALDGDTQELHQRVATMVTRVLRQLYAASKSVIIEG